MLAVALFKTTILQASCHTFQNDNFRG